MALVAEISTHKRQICGIAWSPDGELFATGANDNLCCLFSINGIFGIEPGTVPSSNSTRWAEGSFTLPRQHTGPSGWSVYDRRNNSAVNGSSSSGETEIHPSRPGAGRIHILGPGDERHRWVHGSAVKAMAFCPWRPGLIATSGGTGDRSIHFFHTRSGAALATIAVDAQVTSLVWSTTRREIAAILGYSQPEHPYRIVVFRWPECTQVAAIPWNMGIRALYAIPYPTPSRPGRRRGSRGGSKGHQQGCLVVTASDRTIRFHEIWPNEPKSAIGGPGTLAGSDILESIEGIDKEGEVIR